MGILIRWGALLVGVLIIWISLHRAANQKLVSDTPIDVTVSDLAELSDDALPIHARITGTVDTDRTMHATGLEEPPFSDMPTNVVHTLPQPSSAVWKDARSLRGNVVTYSGPLLPFDGYLARARVRDGEEFEDGQEEWVYAIATTAVAAGKLIIISPRFQRADDPALEHWWEEKNDFWGPLMDLSALDENEPDFEEEQAIRNRPSFEHISAMQELFGELGIDINENTLVLVDQPTSTPTPRGTGGAYAPLTDTENRVLIRLDKTPAKEVETGASGILMKTSPLFNNAAKTRLETPTGHFLILNPTITPGEFNADATSFLQTGLAVIAGSLALFFGLALIFRYDIRRKA